MSGFRALNGRRRAGHDGAGNDLSISFERGPSAAASARNALRALEQKLHGQVLDDIRLLVSELVTNAIRHADVPHRSEIRLEVSIRGECVRVEVGDAGPGFEPTPRDDELGRPGGWGLYLVDRIADRWGVVRNRLNRVWFEIDSGATA